MNKLMLAKIGDQFLKSNGGEYIVKRMNNGQRLVECVNKERPLSTISYAGKTVVDCLVIAGDEAIKGGFNLLGEKNAKVKIKR